jgi:hypothetical protein
MQNFDIFNEILPNLSRSEEVYFGSDAPLAKHLNLYATQLKTLFDSINKVNKKVFIKDLNKIVQNFNRDIAEDINCERIQLSILNEPSDNACAYCLWWNADMLDKVTENGRTTKYVNFDKIEELEGVIITNEGYKYKEPKGKILLVVLNSGCIQKNNAQSIAATIAHELGHCFQDSIFGVYKDVADINLMMKIQTTMNTTTSVVTNGSFIKSFVLFVQWVFFPLVFLSNLARLGGIKHFAEKFKLFNKEKTLLMKDELKRLDNGDTRIKTDKGFKTVTKQLGEVSSDDKDNIVTEFNNDIEKDFKYRFEDVKNPDEEKVRKLKRGPILNFFRSLFANINATTLPALQKITLSNYVLNKYQEQSFTKKYEFFADIFASSYGYAPHLYKNQVKYNNELIVKLLEKDLVGMNDPSLLKMGYMQKQWKIIRRAMVNDCHGVWIQRGNAMYTALQYELKNNTTLTTSQRKEIENHMKQLLEADITYYKDQTENSGFWLKFYETVIQDRIDGKDPKTEEEILAPIQKCVNECMTKK